MNNKKAIIMVGTEGGIDSYQLLIGLNYISVTYCKTDGDYHDFLKKISAEFAKEILSQVSPLEIGILNGFKINESGKHIRIDKLNNELFGNLLTNKLGEFSKGRAAILPVAGMNN